MTLNLQLPQPVDKTERKIIKKLNKLSLEGQNKIVQWTGYGIFLKIMFAYLIKKYTSNIKNTCQIQHILSIDYLTYGSYILSYDQEIVQLIIDNILNCILINNPKIEIILIPFDFRFKNFNDNFEGHQNLLILRISKLTLEHFEPHGVYKNDPEMNLSNNEFLKNIFLKQLNSFFKPNKQIKFIESELVCPYVRGIQSIEDLSLLQKNTGGYCALWTIFFAELVIRNPKLSSQEINKIILKEIYSSNPDDVSKWSDYFRNIATGYTILLNNKLSNYLSKYYGETLSIDILSEMIKNINEVEIKKKLDKIFQDFEEFIEAEKENKIVFEQNKMFENISPPTTSTPEKISTITTYRNNNKPKQLQTINNKKRKLISETIDLTEDDNIKKTIDLTQDNNNYKKIKKNTNSYKFIDLISDDDEFNGGKKTRIRISRKKCKKTLRKFNKKK
jgi:hypothetical protein